MTEGWDISVCGLNCAACDFYKAAQGDNEKQQEIIDWFMKARGKQITPEQTMCLGCRGPKKPHWSPDCPMMNCAEQKGITHCYECSEFVCEKLAAFESDGASHHRRTVENMRKMKKNGLENWIKKQGKPALCP